MVTESATLRHSAMTDEYFYDMTGYLDEIVTYVESIKSDGLNCQFIFYSGRYHEFFNEFGEVIMDIFRLLHPWQVEIFLLKREYMYFYNGPSGPIEVDYVDEIEDQEGAFGPEEYFERR